MMMTTITLSSPPPIKRCCWSPNGKKRRHINRKQPSNISFTVPTHLLDVMMFSSTATTITVTCEKQPESIVVPDLLADILFEQRRRMAIVNLATMLRKVGDQIDEQLQMNMSSSASSSSSSLLFIDHRTMTTFVHCFTRILRFFL